MTLRSLLWWLGVGLVIGWAAFWIEGLRKGRLETESLWFPVVFRVGIDFDINYYGARGWLEGGNPYRSYRTDLWENRYDHPPFVMAMSTATNLLSRDRALQTWLAIQAAIAGLTAYVCYRHRRSLGLVAMPFPLLFAAFAWCHPLVFEMERGNWNSLVLLLVIAAAWALRRESLARGAVAGTSIAMAAWIKMYPGLAFFSLLVLRRRRTAAICAGVATVIGLASLPYLLDFKESLTSSSAHKPDGFGYCPHWVHTIGGSWKAVSTTIGLPWLGKAPGVLVWAVIVLPPWMLLARRVRALRDPSRVLLPYLLWVVAAATYLPAIANDYNLLFLVAAMLASWDRRDSWWVHASLTAAIVCLQPLGLPLNHTLVWSVKVLALVAVGHSIARRMSEQAVLEAASERPAVEVERLAA